jgi:hypothetical protein
MIFVPHKNVTPTGNHGFHPNTGLPGHIFPSLARSRLLELQSSGSSLAPGGRESGKILVFSQEKWRGISDFSSQNQTGDASSTELS